MRKLNRSPLSIIISLVFLLSTAGITSSAPPQANFQKVSSQSLQDSNQDNLRQYVPGQLIVKLIDGQDIGILADLNAKYKVSSYAKLLRDMPGIKVKVTDSEAKEHRLWYWQLDKDSKEYKDYSNRIAREEEKERQKQEQLKAHIELRQQRATGEDDSIQFETTYLLKVSPETNLIEMASAYSSAAQVEYAEPNYICSTSLSPNDTYYSYQWGPAMMGAESAWDTFQGENIRVAVIDTGLDVNHEDISGQVVDPYDTVDIDTGLWQGTYWKMAPDEDYTTPDTDPKDMNGHGTHVAGTIAAITNNSKGVAGMAGKAKIMPVRAGFKILYNNEETAFLETDDIINAIIYATDNGADVINMSLGGGGLSYTLRDAIRYAYNQGCVVVVAAGNSNRDSAYSSPAMYNQVISVAAVDSTGQKASFSNYGHMVDVAAPGVDILSTYPAALTDENYAPYVYMDGTSMACPHVSGAAAVLLSKYPSMTIEQLRATLRATAGDGNGTRNNDLGYGVVKIDRALSASVNHYGNISSPEFFAGVNQGVTKINGSATGSNFKSYKIEYCRGLLPDGPWTTIKESTSKVDSAELAEWDTTALSLGTYTLRLSVEGNGSSYIHQIYHKIHLTTNNQSGWPRIIGFLPGYMDYQTLSPLFADFEGDGSLECAVMSSGGQVYAWDKEGKLKSGFPIELRSSSSTSLNAADINNDGKLEIIAGMEEDSYDRGDIYGFDYQGNLLSGWPPSGLPTGRSLTRMNPSIDNLDGGSDLEVITNVNTGQNKFYGFKSNGAQVSGWPVNNASPDGEAPILANVDGDDELEAIALGNGEILLIDGNGSLIRRMNLNLSYIDTSESPGLTVGDVDGDGRLEIVVCVDTQASGKKYKFFVYELDGTIVSSWEIAEPDNTIDDVYYSRNVVLGDLNKDGKAEIIFATPYAEGTKETDILQNRIYGWDAQGNLFFGKTIDLGAQEGAFAAPVLADLDGDAQPEIVIGTDSGNIYAYNNKGSLVSGFPVETGGWLRAPLAIADVDGDGKLEALAISVDGVANLVELPSSGPADRVEWQMYQHDSRHTGCYIVPDATIPKLKTLDLQSGFEGQKVAFELQAEKGTAPYTYSATSGTLPQGANLASDGTFSWTPGYEQAGSYTIKATVTDSKGNVSEEEQYTVKVDNSSLYGIVKDVATSTIIAGAQLNLVRKSDSATVYTTNSDSQGKYLVTHDIDTGEYRLEASFSEYNDKTVDISLTKGQTSEVNVELTAYVANTAPVFNPASDAETITEEKENFNYTLPLVSESYGQNLTYRIEGNPEWLSFKENNRVLSGKAPYDSERSYTIKWIASDTEGESAFTLTLNVNNKERPPEFQKSSDSLSVKEGEPVEYYFPIAENNYGTGLTYSLSDKPDWASIDTTIGRLTATEGSIPFDGSGSYTLHWIAQDSEGQAAFVLNLTVSNVNRAPVLEPIGNKEISEGSNLSFTLHAADSDGDILSYSTEGKLPKGASFDATGAVFGWRPGYTQAGSYELTFKVSDGNDSDSEEITITVSNNSHAPEFSKASDTRVITEDSENFEYSLPEVDNNYGDNLRYILENKPEWLEYNENSHKLSGKAPYDSKRSYEINWIAKDSEGEATFVLTINVTDKKCPPEFNKKSDKISANEGESIAYSLPDAESKISGETISYSVTEKPEFADVDSSSGKVTGEVPYDAGDKEYQLIWKATGEEGADSFTLEISVKDVNRSPVIETISDYTVNEGEALSFTVNTYDHDSEDILVTTLKHVPDGASFVDLAFKWTPTYKQSGKYTLSLTSSDGKAKTEQDFTIEVIDATEPEDTAKDTDNSGKDDSKNDSSDTGPSESDSVGQDSDTSASEESEGTTSGRSTWVVVQEPKKTSVTDNEKNEDETSASDENKSAIQSTDIESEYEERVAEHNEEEDERTAMLSEPQYDGNEQLSSRDNVYEETESETASPDGASINFMAVQNDKGVLKEIHVLNEHADLVHSYKIKYGKKNSLIGLFRDDTVKAYVYIDTDGITVKKIKIKNLYENAGDIEKEIGGIIAFMGYLKNSQHE